MSDRNVLVSGVGGGGVGEQLQKALRLADRPYRIIGADVQPRSLGLADADVPILLPLASSLDYVAAVLDVCERFGIHALYPGSEPELHVLAKARDRFRDADVALFINTDSVLATCFDKSKTAAFLAAHGFQSPPSILIRSESELASVPFLPATLKPNTGSGGSTNTFVAQTETELVGIGRYLLGMYPAFLAQEYVGTADDEYTVGVLHDLDGAFINSIAVRRNTRTAFSNRLRVRNRTGNPALGDQLVISNGISQGEIGSFPEITSVCERIAAELRSRGPLNIQCRVAGGEVLVFEINPRFSGTTSLRALVGFNEPDLLYRRHVEGEQITPRFAYGSGHITRGLREVLVEPALETLGTGGFHWSLPPLPFVYRPLEAPLNGDGLPDALSLAITVEPDTGLVRQVHDPEVASALERAYVIGSEVPGVMDTHGIGKEYADDFLSLLEKTGVRFGGKSVLEVGCGTGYLLSRMREHGASVLGVEPGAHGQRGTFGVPIVRGFFPCAGVSGEFDIIVLYLVLEHLEHPSKLLAAVRDHLAGDGRVAVVVPDAESFLAQGDVSILFHEHYAYYTAASLAATLRKVGARAINVRRSSMSKLLFALFSFTDGPDDVAFDQPLVERMALAHRFRRLAPRTTARLAAYFAEARGLGESVGVYVPARFVNYIALGGISLDGVRFFDDSPLAHGRYYPGIDIRVENGDDLRKHPTQRVLVMSTSFGSKIKARITPLLPDARITTLDELLQSTP